MSTSANVIEYTICKDGEQVGHHRYNVMCQPHFEDLLKFQPLEDYTISPYGYDEDEDLWGGKSKNLKVFMDDLEDKKRKERIWKLEYRIKKWDEKAEDNENNKHNLSTSERTDWIMELQDLKEDNI